MTTEQIVAKFHYPGAVVPKEELAEAGRRKEEFTSILIAAIESAGQDEAEETDDYLPLFALYLLAEWREARALTTVLEFFTRFADLETTIFWDVVAMDGGHILAGVGRGGPEALQAYVERDDINEDARSSAFSALVLLSQWGELPRDSVVRFFQGLMDTNAFLDDAGAWTGLVGACRQLHPRECLDRIRGLYERELVDEMPGDGFGNVEQEAAEDFDTHQARNAEHRQPITDTADAVGWWDCFADSFERESMTGMDTGWVLDRLRAPAALVPRAALAEVVRRRDEFVPLLIEEIRRATEMSYAEVVDNRLVWSALYLLAEMREERALTPMLDYFATDDEEDDVFGDLLSQDAGRLLASVGHSNPRALQAFVRRRDINPWVRGAGLDALGFQALWGLQPRAVYTDFVRGLIDANQFGDDETAWTMVVCTCLEFYPAELLDHIRKLCERGMVDYRMMGTMAEMEKLAREQPDGQHVRYPEWTVPITDAAEAIALWSQYADELDEENEDDLELWDDDDSFVDIPGEPIRVPPKIGRNDLCPCGSGKKYKKCCLPPG